MKNLFKPDVAIILPVFNGEKTLNNTVKSLLDQSHSNFILYICDDGSKDGSYDLIEKYKSKKIKIFKNKKNMGLGYTLNKLVSLCDEKINFIAMAEQDDFYYSYRLEKQVKYLNKNKDVGLVSGIADHWDGTRITARFPGILVKEENYPIGIEFFKYNYREQIKVVNSCIMFRKDIHNKNKIKFSETYPSLSVDWDYILRFSLKSRIHGLKVSLVRLDRSYSRGSLTTKNIIKYETANKLIKDFYEEFPDIITFYDYKYACATQRYLELGNEKYFVRIKNSFKILFIDPLKIRSLKIFFYTIIKPFLKIF